MSQTGPPVRPKPIPPAPSEQPPSPPGSGLGPPGPWTTGAYGSLPGGSEHGYSRIPPDHIYDYIEDTFLPEPPHYHPPVPTAPPWPHSSTSKPPKGVDLIRRPNTYGSLPPEPPQRTSSLKKKQKAESSRGKVEAGVSVTLSSKDVYGKKGSARSADGLLGEGPFRRRRHCYRCPLVAVVVVVIVVVLAGASVAGALYFLGFFEAEPSSTTSSQSPVTTQSTFTSTSTTHAVPTSSTSRPVVTTTLAPVATRTTMAAPTYMNVTDCDQLRHLGVKESGPYNIQSPLASRGSALTVFCDMKTVGGGWMLFQRREDPRVSFNRSWSEYESGFGEVTGDFWLGNDLVHRLTRGPTLYDLRVELRDRQGGVGWIEYKNFRLDGATTSYVLQLGTGNGNLNENLDGNKGYRFSTYDRDNDISQRSHCAKERGGGWWFIACGYTFLNGTPGVASSLGVSWTDKLTPETAILSVEMKFRPMKKAI